MLKRREFLRIGMASGLSLLAGCQQSAAPGKPVATATVKPTPETSPTPSAEVGGHEFIIRNRRPKDLETPVEVFQDYLTPNERFFVRSHHPEPKVVASDWTLTIEAPGAEPLILSLDDLKAFEPVTVTAVLQCAGNSRGMYEPKVPGVQWGRGAVGNAEWKGARLGDILSKAGVTSESPENVVLRGADKPLMPTVPIFERQIPLSKALHPDTLIAYEMNGEPLPHLHGGPARAVVPGWVADDWIKWITSVRLQEDPIEGFYYAKAYRYPTVPVEPGGAVDEKDTKPMEELVTRSLFSFPSQGAKVSKSEKVKLQGVAWTGGERMVDKVEVSSDGGRTWKVAAFEGEAKPYAWRLWTADWQPEEAGSKALLCRATDSEGVVQSVEPSPWNPSGYLWGSADVLELEVVS